MFDRSRGLQRKVYANGRLIGHQINLLDVICIVTALGHSSVMEEIVSSFLTHVAIQILVRH